VAGGGAADDALAAHVAFGRNRLLEAEQLAARAAAGTDVDPGVTCEALEMVGRCARARGRADAAHDAFAKAAEVAQRHDLLPWRVRALHELGTLEMLEAAERESLDRARELAVEAGMLSTAAVLDLQIAASLGTRTQHDEMRRIAVRGHELAVSLGLRVLSGACLGFVASADAWAGRHAQMAATLATAESLVRGDPDGQAAITFVRTLPALLEHDLPRLRAGLEAGMRLVRTNSVAGPSPYRGLYALLETVLGDGDSARLELRASGATVHIVNHALLGYADAVAAGRRGEDPLTHLTAAEGAMRPFPWRRHHARLLAAPAALADGWGTPNDWLREALPFFSDFGHAGLARACRDLLRAQGVPVPRRGRGDTSVPPHLRAYRVTSREMDVLMLVVAGESNGAIAEQLVLSPRTVETHVASLLSKTGATNRAELANYVTPPS
jgi:DNA-binding CsgD family transcriptional regulator